MQMCLKQAPLFPAYQVAGRLVFVYNNFLLALAWYALGKTLLLLARSQNFLDRN
jgi:hypothetical protein